MEQNEILKQIESLAVNSENEQLRFEALKYLNSCISSQKERLKIEEESRKRTESMKSIYEGLFKSFMEV